METVSYHSFYKILMDLTDKLGLPEGFTDKYDEVLPNAKLKIASGATWEVRVEKLEGEGYFFTSGWTEFCRDMKLEMLEILVFSYDGNSTFHVSVFANTAFEKKSNFRGFKNPHFKVCANTAFEKKSNFRGIKNPHFKVSLKNHHRSTLYLRLGFVEASGLTNKRKVRLEYVGGQSAEVALRTDTRHNYSRLGLGKGLSGFWKANRLTVNKTYSFEFIPNKNVILVEPVELEEEIEHLTFD